jgi:hypothetical protein
MQPSPGPSPPLGRRGLSLSPPLGALLPRPHPNPGAAKKNKHQQQNRGGVKSKMEGAGRSQEGKVSFFPAFTLTRTSWRTSRPTATSVSSRDRRVDVTYEQASSVPLVTCPQSAKKEGVRGKPGIPNSRSPETVTSKDPGAGRTSPTMTS